MTSLGANGDLELGVTFTSARFNKLEASVSPVPSLFLTTWGTPARSGQTSDLPAGEWALLWYNFGLADLV